jgi:protein disulfide-isomerase
MKKITLGLLACWMLMIANAAEGEWLTDLTAAQTKAKAENKLVLVDFTGSDWCPPCKALHKNVLSAPEFTSFAKTNLVLVEVDFPRSKEQSKELKEANKALAEKYNVTGYPTVIVLNGDGKVLKRETGYGGDDAKDYIAKLAKLKK